jgi:hypothetical protein
VDGKTDASTVPGDMLTQVLLGQLPMFFAAHPRDVCVIGYGSGVTVHSVLTHPVSRVDTIEIEPQVVEASRFFEGVNGAPLQDRRQNLILDDARSALAYRKQDYDVIISEPSNPWMIGVNNLFTTEFYAQVRHRLRPGGVFCQWIQAYELSDESLRVLLNTVTGSFRQAHLFGSHMGADMLVIASDEPVSLSPSAATLLQENPEVRGDLGRVGVTDLADLAIFYTVPLLPPEAGSLLNTDDNSWMQYRAPLEMLRGDDPDRGFLRGTLRNVVDLFFPGEDEGRALLELGRAAHRRGTLPTLQFLARQLSEKGDLQGAGELQALAAGLEAELTRGEQVRGALTASEARIGEGDPAGAREALKQAQSTGLSTSEEFARAGFILMTAGGYEQAERYLNRAVELGDPRYMYKSLASRGACRYRLGRPEEGLSYISRAKQADPEGSLAYLLMASAFFDAGHRDSAVQEITEGRRIAPGDPRFAESLRYFTAAPSHPQ